MNNPGDQWQQLLEVVSQKMGYEAKPEDVLLLIGIRESEQPPKSSYTENEKFNLVLMAEQTVLVPARYYQLLWVEDNGWPHYQAVQHLPRMEAAEKIQFLQPWIIQYAIKNRMI